MSQPQRLRRLNRRQILTTLFDHDQLTRPQLAALTGLSKVTVNAVVQDLIEQNVVHLVTGTSHTTGRVPQAVELHPCLGTVLAIDLQPEFLNAHVLGLALHPPRSEQARLSIENPNEQAAGLIETVHRSAPFGPLRAVLIGLPAPVDHAGQVGEPNALAAFDVCALNAATKKLGVSVRYENDANLVTLSLQDRYPEFTHLAALIERPSGTGMGLILGGHLYRGVHGRAGELGRSPWPTRYTQAREPLEQLPWAARLDAIAYTLAALSHTLDLEHIVLGLQPERLCQLHERLPDLLAPSVTVATETDVPRSALHGAGLCALRHARELVLSGGFRETHVA
ncbi:ROK family transcriptional regulator [Deinococcus malanensis]|uniref:ROK family transcriptional regulator n=1 Tax=Deinococcus malanensis TaxID=1706855 RepID=UPI001667DE2C|nr:ROK family protein [Deinococcus malanensis]